MSAPKGLAKENSETIGFVAAALATSAIDADELHEWVYALMRAHDVESLPSYIIELADYRDYPTRIHKVIGFVPDWKHTRDDEAALYGIAVKRGKERYEWPVKPEVALEKLAKNPKIKARFRETFPFIRF